MSEKVLHDSNYTYDPDAERIVRYVPGRLDAFYSANQAGHNDRLERFIYQSGLLTVKTLPSMNNQFKQIATYTKHYYIGAERISSVIGRGNGIGQNLLEPCDSSFPSTQDIFMMNNQKVQEAEDALQDDYQFFEKQLVMSESFSNRPSCFAMSYTGEHNTYWFHPNHLGSSSYISNKNKEISQHLEYFPFGETLVEEHKNSNNSPYKFNAKELDDETGNYYYGARYLNPKFSIWLSVDPLAEKRFGISPYNYVQNNPLNRIDPDGLTDFTINKKTGDVSQSGEANDEPDRILKTDKDGNVKRKGVGFLGFLVGKSERGKAKVAFGGVEKGILSDGQNLRTKDNAFKVGGEGQPSEQGVEAFALKLSDYVGTEIGGAYFSTNGEESTTHITIGGYDKNSYKETKSHGIGAFRQFVTSAEEFTSSITGFFHTHPNGVGISDRDRLVPSLPDRQIRDSSLEINPSLKFFILTHPEYGGKFPRKIPYTKGYPTSNRR